MIEAIYLSRQNTVHLICSCVVLIQEKPFKYARTKPRENSMKNRGRSPMSDHHNKTNKETRGSSSGRSPAGSGISGEQDVFDVIQPQQVIAELLYKYIHIKAFISPKCKYFSVYK